MTNKYLKTTIYITAFFAVCAGIGCNKFLNPDPVSSISEKDVFSSVGFAQAAVIGIYNDLAGDNGYGSRISLVYPYDNDEMLGASGSGDNDRKDMARYNTTSLNLQLYAPFVQLYEGVGRANLCIYNIPKMDLYTKGNGIQQGELKRLLGEALTLRAQFYLELIRNWGDVPAQFDPAEHSNTFALPKTNRDSIYNRLVLVDLPLAETLVPWRTELSSIGDQPDERITKGAVKALRARIALYRAGYSLRKDLTNVPPSDALSFYKIARDECADLINRRDQHTLNPSFKAIFKDGIDAHTPDPTNEILFQVAMGGGNGSTDSKIGQYNGTRFILSSDTAKSGTVTTTYLGSATLIPLPTYFYLFDSSDLRRDVTIAPYDTWQSNYSKVGIKMTTIHDGKFRIDWIKKPTPIGITYWGINWPLIRFSDVLLMYAEADNELSNGTGPSAAAIAAYEEVRTRGYGGNKSLIGTTPTDHDGFFKAIVRERALEFGGEGIRKYDLIRWGLLGTAISQTQTNINTMSVSAVNPVTTYMAPPPAYATAGPLAKSMYFYTPGTPQNPASSASTAVDDAGIWANSFYAKAPSTSPWNKVTWIGTALQTAIKANLGSGFHANHSELLPLPQSVIDASGGVLKQDYGY
ncbi:RagB/SusD family nutrient uptake outer membrane protein [Parasediminibacterium sp. JCM 36343]|uniref:RagB/SusD family nutrient uptake outer membrane protein n=1 Tax=Parasediminibacterium sp. JCM 36343 TaxID=3374279 RepID=UPI00397ADCA3